MASGLNRILSRLDDGRFIYRLHPHAAAIVLTEAEYRSVELVLRWRALSTVGISLSLILLFFLARVHLAPVRAAAVLGAAIFLISFVVDLVLDAADPIRYAPRAPDRFQVKTKPSRLRVAAMVVRKTFRALPGSAIWTCIIFFALALLGAFWKVWIRLEGHDQSVSDTHPAVLVTFIFVAAFGLSLFSREDGRRRRHKQDRLGTGAGDVQ